MAQDYNFTPWSLLRVGSFLQEERTCCGWAGQPLEPVNSQYSHQPLAHQALVEVGFAIRAPDQLLAGGTGKLPTAQK